MKNKILIATVVAAAILACTTACLIDTNSLLITIPCLACLAYIWLFVYANFEYKGKAPKPHGRRR